MANSHRSRNLGILSRRFKDYRERAVTALQFGQSMIEAGLKMRAPIGPTGKLHKTIRKSKVKNDHARHRLVAYVIVTRPYAKYVEYGTKRSRAHPFVRPTQAIDGPLAVMAMQRILTG